MPIDYKALIADRKAKQTRPIVRHPICLAPELYADLEEAQAEVRHWHVQSIDEDEDGAPLLDRRAGGTGSTKARLAEAQAKLEEVEARVSEVSVEGVFKVWPAPRQSQYNDKLQAAREENPERTNEIIVEHTRTMVLETFDRFEVARERIDLSRDDLVSVIEEWSHGEILSLASKIQNASVGAPDIPFSVQQSLRKRASAATSKQR